MKKYFCLLLAFVVTFAISHDVFAQIKAIPSGKTESSTPITTSKETTSEDNPMNKHEPHYLALIGAGFIMGFPQGELKNELNKISLGLDIYAAYCPPSTALAVGIDAGFMTYGTEKTTQALGNGALSKINVNVETDYNFVTAHGFLRLQPDLGTVSPYLDGLIGLNYFYTKSEVKSQNNNPGNTSFASSTNYDDATFSYGFAGGVSIKIFTNHVTITDGKKTGSESAVYLDARVRYLLGGNARYLREGDITIAKDANGNDTPIYTPAQSKTDMISAQIGISFRL
jgi:hypothetical protein